MNRFVFTIFVFLLYLFPLGSSASEWQWSVKINGYISDETSDNPRAFLWIPSNCKQVKSVVFGQHNMLEEGIMEDPVFRKKMAELGIAEIWITPGLDIFWDPKSKTQERFNAMLDTLALISGYSELKYAPVIPMGHSAYATFPWNFAAQNNERTLAVLSIHGDAPSTNLTGYGRPNLDWSNLKIDGIPGLMVEGEYEWWEARVQPGLNYKRVNPNSCVSFLCDAGRGHFDISEQMIEYLIMFIEKAVKYRLPKKCPIGQPVKLIHVDPQKGWLADRWHRDSLPNAKADLYGEYKGNKDDAFWYFDEQIVMQTEKIYARQRGKKEQYLGFVKNGKLLDFNEKNHARYIGKFEPESDGLTVHISAAFTDSLHRNITENSTHTKINISRICGPVDKVNDTTFTIRFYRMGLNNIRRTNTIWLIASNDGDCQYKSTVQQFNLTFPFRNTDGTAQTIQFDTIPNINRQIKSIAMFAKSSSGLTVNYYVQEGPAEIQGNKLEFTPIPPRAKFPVKVAIVAWQHGRNVEPMVKTAEPVTRTIYIYK